MPISIRAAQSSRDRDAIYRLRAAQGRSVSMSPSSSDAPVARVFELADVWPETVLLLVESEDRCLGCARIDGHRILDLQALEDRIHDLGRTGSAELRLCCPSQSRFALRLLGFLLRPGGTLNSVLS